MWYHVNAEIQRQIVLAWALPGIMIKISGEQEALIDVPIVIITTRFLDAVILLKTSQMRLCKLNLRWGNIFGNIFL